MGFNGLKEMDYLVLARKWRPQLFSEVVGQAHITKTLENAIISKRIHHAFLFTGPRGVGKTSVARILAKALNCIHGPTPTPCNKCVICEEITEGHSLDVIEIDGASNTSVDDVRELKDNIRYLPSKSRYKIYIIDEVHMLSNSAFNALLKTLEEPPKHAIFIFATTEPHKIPLTVISRCQRFDFRRIPARDIINNLKSIASKEGVDIADEALFLIARESEGSLRDAQSILDQLISYKGNNISPEDVVSLLGIMDRRMLYDLLSGVIERDPYRSLKIIEDAYNYGFDLKKLISDLLDLVRNIMIVKITPNYRELIELPDNELRDLIDLSKRLEIEEVQRFLNILLRGEEELLRSESPKIVLELALVKMLHVGPIIPINKIIERLENLEKRLSLTKEIKEKEVKEKELEEKEIEEKEITKEETSWDNFLNFLKEKKPFLSSLLENPKSVDISEEKISLLYNNNNSFIKDSLKDKENINILKSLVKEYFKKDLNIEIEVEENAKKKETEKAKNNLLDHPSLKKILDTFGGEIVEIKEINQDKNY